MNWLTENWKDIAAIIGMVYALALAIVKLTPTPKDDDAMEKVNIILKIIAKVLGLDLKQGINKKTPLICLLVCSTMLTSCGTITGIRKDPAKQYQLTAITFSESVNVLATMRKAGKLSSDQVSAIDRVVRMGNGILDEWSSALKEKQSYPDGTDLMAPIILQLKDFIRVQGSNK